MFKLGMAWEDIVHSWSRAGVIKHHACIAEMRSM